MTCLSFPVSDEWMIMTHLSGLFEDNPPPPSWNGPGVRGSLGLFVRVSLQHMTPRSEASPSQ